MRAEMKGIYFIVEYVHILNRLDIKEDRSIHINVLDWRKFVDQIFALSILIKKLETNDQMNSSKLNVLINRAHLIG